MARVGVDDGGASRRVADQLHAVAADLADLDPVTAEAGRVVIAAARPPLGATRQLAAGQTVRATPGGVELVSTVRYFTFVEWGAPRAGTRAQPWLAEALTVSRDDVEAIYAAHVNHTLSTVKG